MKALTILTNGFEDIEAIGTIALLKRAGIEVDIACLHGNSATGKYDTTITNLKNLYDLDYKKYDLVFIPGGPEYVELSSTPKVLEIIKFAAEHAYLAGICAAPTIFQVSSPSRPLLQDVRTFLSILRNWQVSAAS